MEKCLVSFALLASASKNCSKNTSKKKATKITAADRAKRYHRGRAKLIEELGGACVKCGKKYSLEFHHKNGCRTWVARQTSRWVRLARYKREAAEGLIELLCGKCNKEAGKGSSYKQVSDEPIP